jgi:hypothetical protein
VLPTHVGMNRTSRQGLAFHRGVLSTHVGMNRRRRE